MHIIGTAGHVDHGKSALISALTGTNPDRLAEEQARGMTLDLGFAHLRFDDGIEAGIIDVPGHERFVHNMLAGAAGMELLLLVVDVKEGVMPQTLEHLAIVAFLNVRRTLIVVSKSDLVEASQLEESIARIRAGVEGTIAQESPVYAVSALTGAGLDRLKAALHDELATLRPRDANAPAYLPIDRAFVLPGLGTVVTGTLMQGRIATGETLRLEPGGKVAHVRSIGVFESTRNEVEAGSRVALSLPALDRCDVARGQAIVGSELHAQTSFDVRFVPLPSSRGLLRRRTPVRAYVGSAEIIGTLATNDFTEGTEIRAQLHLRTPAVIFPGLRIVLRRQTPMTLLGGAYVEGAGFAIGQDRSADQEAVAAVLRSRGIEGAQLDDIAFGANLREGVAKNAVDQLVERGDAIRVARPAAYVEGDAARRLLAAIERLLEESHRREPWSMGMTSIALSRAVGVTEQRLVPILRHFAVEGRLGDRVGYYALPHHRPSLTAEQQAFFDFLVPVDESQPLLPIPFTGAAAAVRLSRVSGVTKAFETLLAQAAFVKIGDDLYRHAQIAQIRARIEAHFRENERMTAADFRDLVGTSRKYAVPLLEWLDARSVTIRHGAYRSLRKSSQGEGAPASHSLPHSTEHSCN
jgi:selenocysteine-specific elongation factor